MNTIAQCFSLRGFAFSEEETGQSELDGGMDNLLGRGPQGQLHGVLSGHRGGKLFHVNWCRGQDFSSSSSRLLERNQN